jgi:hypothetical protein
MIYPFKGYVTSDMPGGPGKTSVHVTGCMAEI